MQSINHSKPLKKKFYYRTFNCGAYQNVQFHLRNCLWLPIENQNFGGKMATYGKFQLTYNSKPLKKQVVL